MSISEKIDHLRYKRGISLTHLNKAIGAYRGKITDVKNGKSSFSDIEISILARELHTTTDYLLGRTDDPRPAGDQKENPLTESQRILESVNSSENIDLLLHIIKNEASLSREQLLKLQGFVSALEAEDK
jgi:transcriptional regulator with XRE-family HTH domain